MNQFIEDFNNNANRATSKIYRFLATIAVVLSIMGVVTFSLFILEESFQTVMFGTWPAQDAQRWDLVKRGTEHMQRSLDVMEAVNTYFGWIQPFAYISYREYAKSEAYYIEALRAKAMANAPELFVGEHVEISFKPQSAQRIDGGLLLISGSIGIVCRDDQRQSIMTASGVLTQFGNRYAVDIR